MNGWLMPGRIVEPDDCLLQQAQLAAQCVDVIDANSAACGLLLLAGLLPLARGRREGEVQAAAAAAAAGAAAGHIRCVSECLQTRQPRVSVGPRRPASIW
jgi:hypothetical protein